MTMNAKIYWLHALTPLHVGSGKGVGFIDLPVMREKVTEWPIVPGSAVKGVLRDRLFQDHQGDDGKGDSFLRTAFGEGGEDTANAGALVQTDARIVCLPIRSLYGTFAWVSSPMVLSRLRRDAEAAGADGPPGTLPSPGEGTALCTQNTALASGGNDKGTVYLEDLDLAKGQDGGVDDWADFIAGGVFSEQDDWQTTFRKRFTVVPDDIFNYLSEFGTQVNARIRIDDSKKTVQKSALWYEEALPAETILSGLAWVDGSLCRNGTTSDAILSEVAAVRILQLGGNSTIGMGRVRYVISGNGEGGES